MTQPTKRKAGQYCRSCRKPVMAVNDTSRLSTGGWYCPFCGQHTISQGAHARMGREAVGKPTVKVTCPRCVATLSYSSGPRAIWIKCAKCGKNFSIKKNLAA